MLKYNKEYQEALNKLVEENKGFVNCGIGKNDPYGLPNESLKEGTPLGINGMVAGYKGPTYMF